MMLRIQMNLNTAKIPKHQNMDLKTAVKCANNSIILTQTKREESARRLNLQRQLIRTFTLSTAREKLKFVGLTFIQMHQHKTVFCNSAHSQHTTKSLSNKQMAHINVRHALMTTPFLTTKRRGHAKRWR